MRRLSMRSISIMAGSTADESRLFMGEGVNLSLEEQKIHAQHSVGEALRYLKEEDKKSYEEFQRVCRLQEPGLIETEFLSEVIFRVALLQQLDVQSAFNKTFFYYWSYPGSNPDIGAAHSVELIFEFNLRGVGTARDQFRALRRSVDRPDRMEGVLGRRPERSGHRRA